MKKMVSAILIAITLITSIQSNAEVLFDLPDNFSIAEGAITKTNYVDLKEYFVTYRNLQDYYEPENFSTCSILSTDKYSADNNQMENYIGYVFSNGHRLIMPNAVTLIYGDENREKYEQLIYYFENTSYPNENMDLSFQKLDDAVAACIDKLDTLGINNLFVDKAISFSLDMIDEQTINMLAYYKSDTIKYFHNATKGDEAYYISFRYYIDGVQLIGEPQAEFVVTANGICSIKLYRIFDNVYNESPISSCIPMTMALAHFVDGHHRQMSELDLYTIKHVECTYYPIYEQKNSLAVRYVPCWLILGTCKYHFGNRSKEVPVRGLYSVKDGTQYDEW